LHTIAGLKIALKKKLKVIIIIREPKNAILSFYYTKLNTTDTDKRKGKKILNRTIQEYCDYYDFVYNNKASLKILAFERVVNRKIEFINSIVTWLRVEPDIELNEQSISNFEEVYGEIVSRQNSLHYGSLPNKVREVFKKEVGQTLDILPEYQTALDLYKKLT
jgi:hypothetical protein